jgi:hypothetical protein
MFKDSKRSENVIFLPIGHPPISEVEGTNSENNVENAEKRDMPVPN